MVYLLAEQNNQITRDIPFQALDLLKKIANRLAFVFHQASEFLSGTANVIVFHFHNILYYYNQDLFRKRSACCLVSAQASSGCSLTALLDIYPGNSPFLASSCSRHTSNLGQGPKPFSEPLGLISPHWSLFVQAEGSASSGCPAPAPGHRVVSSAREFCFLMGISRQSPAPDSDRSEEKPKPSDAEPEA